MKKPRKPAPAGPGREAGEIRIVPVDVLQEWDKNPRDIDEKDFARLKAQIVDLGVYKPLVVCEDGARLTVLGGNMRLRAIRDLGIDKVAVSVVRPRDEADRVKYALSDNDRAGHYVEQSLAELVRPVMAEIDVGVFRVDIGSQTTIDGIVEQFSHDEAHGAMAGELAAFDGKEEIQLVIYIPRRHVAAVREWLAGDELKTPAGMGRGVLKKCGLL